jgi:hypothetical protein
MRGSWHIEICGQCEVNPETIPDFSCSDSSEHTQVVFQRKRTCFQFQLVNKGFGGDPLSPCSNLKTFTGTLNDASSDCKSKGKAPFLRHRSILNCHSIVAAQKVETFGMPKIILRHYHDHSFSIPVLCRSVVSIQLRKSLAGMIEFGSYDCVVAGSSQLG